ncbi:MAG: DUF192 domain-containing protein [Hyphomicrobiaceae bacterium]|nr:DUF192 domain-containing protein [Hyphomicrobiaceae bacterium]MCC0010166.1 DUF192 domain-containing protein [Hyphomicrobiaceae bacterium]
MKSRTAPGAVLFLVFVLVLVVIYLFAAPWRWGGGVERPDPSQEQLVLVTETGRHPVGLEIADTEEKKQVGLMFRTELADDHGMLFAYDSPREITMWMRNTYISLDMIFIGEGGRVVSVSRQTEPMSEEIISSRVPALAVLEMKAGSAEHYQVKPGSRVEHPLFSKSSQGGK